MGTEVRGCRGVDPKYLAYNTNKIWKVFEGTSTANWENACRKYEDVALEIKSAKIVAPNPNKICFTSAFSIGGLGRT